MDTIGIQTRIGRVIWTLLDMRRETEGHILVGIVILGFLTISNKSQASSTFEALNSACHSRFQKEVRTPVEMRGRLGLSVGSLQGFRNPFIL